MKYQQRTASNSSNVHARTMNACGCQSWQWQWYFLKQEQHTYLPKPRKLIVFSADVIACFPTEKLILNHQHFKYKIKTMSRRRDEIKWLTGALSMTSGIVGTSCAATEITLSESHEHEISIWRSSADLNSLVTMGERLKAALRGYFKYRLIMRIIWAFVGVVVGIAGCIAFAKVYHNYNAAAWAGVSALFAVVFLHLHFAVRRDIERIIPKSKFTVIMYIGLTGLIAGVVGFFTNLALGIHRHETGILIVVLTQRPEPHPQPNWGYFLGDF